MKLLTLSIFLCGFLFGQDVKPKVIKAAPPKYPKEAIKQKIEGAVHLQFTLSKTAEIRDINVLKSSSDLLSKSAIAALKQYKFSPAKKDGKAVKTTLTLPIRYKLSR